MPTKTVWQVQAIARDVVTCKRCGTVMHVSVAAYGEADVTFIDRRDDMDAAVAPALKSDARRTCRLVRCAGCKRRSGGWVAIEIARASIGLVAAIALFAVAPDREDVVWAVIIALALWGAIGLLALRNRLRNADACVVMLAPPTSRPEPRASLPRAVAVGAPVSKPAPAPPRKPPPPIAPAAPPLAPGVEPSFLTSKD